MQFSRSKTSLRSTVSVVLVILSTGLTHAADDNVMIGKGNSRRPANAPFVATPEEIARIEKNNLEIAAGFARLDKLVLEVRAARAKIKQAIDNHQEMAICIALQQASNEVRKLHLIKRPLSNEEKQALIEYQTALSAITADMRTEEAKCPSLLNPR